MILTCPECASRYSLDDKAIGPNGRTVRCTQCDTAWFVSEDADNVDMHAMTTEPEPVLQIDDLDTNSATDEDIGQDPDRKGAHVVFRERIDFERRMRLLMGVRLIWLLTIGGVLLFLVLAVLFRQPIVNKAPAAASIYKVFGLTVKKHGLDLHVPTTRTVLDQGQYIMIVNGVIENLSADEVQIPLIKLTLKSNSDEILASWLVEPPQPTIGPKSRLEYATQYPNPPVDAVSLGFTFADEMLPVPQPESDVTQPELRP